MSDQSLPRVLVVDDYALMREVISGLVKALGFEEVDVAPDGATALMQLYEREYGLVISDLNMEPINGMELLKTVRRQPELKEIPFIMTTASSLTENAISAKRAGASTYLVKPFGPKALQAKIEAALGSPLARGTARDQKR